MPTGTARPRRSGHGRAGSAYAPGRAVGEELSYLDQRVLFIGSGGLFALPAEPGVEGP